MALFDSDDKYPEPETGDRIAQAGKTAVQQLPIAGAILGYVFETIVTPPLERRQRDWLNSLNERLLRLEALKRLDLDSLAENSVFLDAVVTATRAAQATSERSKLDALRAAVLNSALGIGPDELSQQLFLTWIDRFTGLHLQLLKLFYDPRAWRKDGGQHLTDRMQGDAADVLEEALPAFATERGRTIYAAVWADLYAAGLVRLNTLNNQGEGPGIMNKRTNSLGDAFVTFVTNPLPH